MELFAQIIGVLMLIPAFLKMYYIIKLENIKGRYFPSPIVFGKIFLFWPFPYFKSENPKKKEVIRKLNITTAVFWGMFVLIILVLLISVALP